MWWPWLRLARAAVKPHACLTLQPRQTTGSVAAKPGTGHCRSQLEQYRQWLLDLVAAEPDLTLEEIAKRLRAVKKHKAGISSIWRFYERQEITFKKNSARRRAGSS